MKYSQCGMVGEDLNNETYGQLDKCGWCDRSLRTTQGIKGVKVGFRLFHERCLPEYQEAVKVREKALQGPSRGNVVELPPCLNTEGWYDWTHGERSPDGIDGSIYDRAVDTGRFTWY